MDASGEVYVADTGNNRIEVFTSSGAYLTQWGSAGSGNGQFANPGGVAVNATGTVYVADTDNDRIQMFGTGVVPTRATTWGHIKSLYR